MFDARKHQTTCPDVWRWEAWLNDLCFSRVSCDSTIREGTLPDCVGRQARKRLTYTILGSGFNRCNVWRWEASNNPGYFELPSLKFTYILISTTFNKRNVWRWEASNNPGYFELPSLKFTCILIGTILNKRNVWRWEASNNRVPRFDAGKHQTTGWETSNNRLRNIKQPKLFKLSNLIFLNFFSFY